MVKFEISARFVFDGVFKVEADTIESAREKIKEHCGLVMGGYVHTTAPEGTITWEFPAHPEKYVSGDSDPHVVAVGDIVNGVNVYGPFPSLEAACAWGNNDPHIDNNDWHPVELLDPEV